MKKPRWAHEPHLAVRKVSISPGGEWEPQAAGWTLIQVGEGTGYCLQPDLNQQLEAGAVLLVGADARVTIRASRLGRLILHLFHAVPTRLGGVLTVAEQDFFRAAASRKEFSFRVFRPDDPVSARMRSLCACGNGLLLRLKRLELFAEMFGRGPDEAPTDLAADARVRLRNFLKETPPSELQEMSLSAVAQRTHCTTRHLSRIFREMVGVSFREKRAELRLARARELLATSDSKIVDVALESGYRSLSLFNLMFSRRFGTSPSRWRQRLETGRVNGAKNAPMRASDDLVAESV